MTDVPPSDESAEAAAARAAGQGYPPPPSSEPAFDDDALAAALEATIATYTQPISIVPPAPAPAPEPYAPEPLAAEPPAPERYAPEPYAAEPYAAEPYAAEPYAAEPYAAEPFAPEPSAPEPVAAEPSVPEPYAPEPYVLPDLQSTPDEPPASGPLESPAYASEYEYEAPDVPEYIVPRAPPAPDYEVPPAPEATDYEPPPPPSFDPPDFFPSAADAAEPAPAGTPEVEPQAAPLFPVPDESNAAGSGPSTLDAIQRLQDELERRGAEEAATPAPEATAPAAEAPPWEPALDHPAAGHVFPSPYQPFGEPAPATESPAAEPPAAQFPAADFPVADVPAEGIPEQPPVPAESPVVPQPPAAFDRPADPPHAPEPPAAPVADDWGSAPPPAFQPPPLVEPPAPIEQPAPIETPAAPEATPPSTPTEGATYVAPTVLPPLREVRLEDVQGLPPPIGMQAAPLPPYDPNVPVISGVPASSPPAAPAFGAPPVAPPPSVPPFAASPDASDPFAAFAAPVSPDAFSGEYGTPVAATSPEPDPVAVAMGATESPSLDENDDAVDDIDRIDGPLPADAAAYAAAGAYPSEPISTQRLTESQPGLVDQRPESHPVFVIEDAGVEPTALDLRAGRAARLFWLWFATNSSVVSLAIGAVLVGLGMSLRQAIVATLAGVALSFLPLGLGTLAGKWSGQPTMVVSRATFGHIGNILPALLAVLTRVFWGAVLLWVLAISIARLLVFAGLDAGLGETVWTYVTLAVGFLIAGVVALFGYGFVARLQLILSIVSGLLVAGVIYLTLPHLDVSAALAVGDGPWTLVIGGAVVVFSFVGLAWVQSGSDVARYQRVGSSGAQSMLWATIGATLPPFALIVWGAMLAASDPVLATGLTASPLPTLARLLPLWYPAPLLAAAGLGLLSSVVLSIYSGGFALQAVGLRAKRHITTVVAAVLVAVVAVVLVVLAADAFSIARDLATTLAVPVAAWAGIFSAEMMIRTRRFDSVSLLAPGGVYPQVRVINLVGFLVISAIGFGLSSATFAGLTWQGYLFPLLGISADDPVATGDVGVLVALLLGIILALATAIPAIRRQERDSLKLEHTGPIPRITGSIPRQTGAIPRQTGALRRPTAPAETPPRLEP